MTDLKTLVEHEMERAGSPPYAIGDLVELRDRKRRSKRISAGVVALAIFAAPVALFLFARLGVFDRTPTPVGPGPSVTVPGSPEVDYVIDLNTDVRTPLPEAIIRSLGETGVGGAGSGYRYAASPDGSLLAYVGTGEEGSRQIFIGGIDGAGIRQVTHDPKGAMSPAWSPNGASIAYVGYGSGDARNLFVLEIATSETRQITDETRGVWGPSFTPDGSSLVYTDPGSASDAAEMRTVPVAGGPSTILFGGGHGGMGHAGEGSMSPDGLLVTMTGHQIGGPGAQLFVSNVDGTQKRAVAAYGTTPAGTWSPDGSRIVGKGYWGRIIIVDTATGNVSRVAEGRAAIWLDDQTLLVDA